MINNLGLIYNYFSQNIYTLEKHSMLRRIVMENKYNTDNIFMNKIDIRKLYQTKKQYTVDYYDNLPNDIESNLDEVKNETTDYEEDNDSICSHVVIDCQITSYEDDFFYV